MNQKKKQKTVADKDFQDQIKQVKNYLAQGKALVEKAEESEHFEQAIQIFNKAILKATSIQISNSYMLYYYRGLSYLNLKFLQKAERDFVEAINLADQKGKVLIYNCLGRCKFEMANDDPTYLEQAIKSYQRAIQYSKGTDGDSMLRLAQIYRKTKNNQQAIRLYTDCLKNLKQAQHFEAYAERGLCNRQIGKFENSIADFQKACQLNEKSSQLHYNLGISYMRNNKYDMALTKFAEAIKINPLEPQYFSSQGLAQYMSNQYLNCLKSFKDALAIYNDNRIISSQVSLCWYNLGNAYLQLNQLDEAILAFRMSHEFNIKNQQRLKVYYSEGLAYQNKKSIQAINKFNQCLSLISDRKENDLYLSTLFHLALNEYSHKKYIEAIRDTNKIMEEGCQDKIVYQLRGKIYLQDEKYELALKDFETVYSLDLNYSGIFYYLGMAKSNLGQIDAAIADFFKAIELGNRSVNIMKGISYAYLKAGKPDKALVYINIALQKQPCNQNFLIQRSMVYLQLSENHKGIQDLTKSLSLNNTNYFTYYRRGICFYKNKQFDQAIGDLKKSLQYQPSEQIQSDIYYTIGVSFANKQQYLQAIDPFTKAIQLKKLAKYYHERAKCHILLDNNKQALQDLNQVICQQPLNAFAYFRRGLAYKALKMYEQSAENFMKARELSPEDPKLILNKKQIYQIKSRKLCQPGQQQ